MQLLRGQAAKPEDLAQALPALAKLGPPANLRCWVRATPSGPLAVAQGGAQVAQVVLIDAAGRPTVVAESGRPDPDVPTHHWLATPWSALPVGDLPPWSLDEAPLAREQWWRELPLTPAGGGALAVHVVHDSDFCKGFRVFIARDGRWRAAAGGGEGCLIGEHHLQGIADLDGNGQPERLETVALADFAGDGDQPAVVTLRLIAGGAIAWGHPRIAAFFQRLWLGEDPEAPPESADDPDDDEPDRDIEAGDLADCLERLPELAEHLHAGALAQIPATRLRSYVESRLGRLGQGTCWNCRGDVDDAKRCRSALRAVRCLVDRGATGYPALAACWRGPL
ncbi:MAG: hypothetical protein HY902_07150 [Deltaproteobacteria bacterium]|nr:hypothetical protein [Deltaproteobacteria bacterium]